MTTRDFRVSSALPLGLEPGAEPVEPRLAATVMLVRDGSSGLEVFMLRRVAGMAFAPSMHVFPGGGVDPRDLTDDLPWAGPDADEWADVLGCDVDAARGVLAAAAREVFEETGVLLASPVDPADERDPVDVLGGRAAATRTRTALGEREVAFAEVLESAGLRLRSDLLDARAHWITPVVEPRRYDTYFFLAEVPAGQEPDGETSEADHAAWLRPQQVLDAHAAGEALMLPPTIVCLERLAAARAVGRAMEQRWEIAPVMPVLAETPDGPVMRAELP